LVILYHRNCKSCNKYVAILQTGISQRNPMK
jgi:predicted DCC family thiol-disulfide oxidoreductase YuxK